MAAKPRKKKIAAALREQVWLTSMGEQFKAKCTVTWCSNQVTVFNFQCGHLLAESKGGPTTLENLRPICGRCNQSMGTMHMDQWLQLGGMAQNGQSPFFDKMAPPKRNWWQRLRQCFGSSGAANECTPAK